MFSDEWIYGLFELFSGVNSVKKPNIDSLIKVGIATDNTVRRFCFVIRPKSNKRIIYFLRVLKLKKQREMGTIFSFAIFFESFSFSFIKIRIINLLSAHPFRTVGKCNVYRHIRPSFVSCHFYCLIQLIKCMALIYHDTKCFDQHWSNAIKYFALNTQTIILIFCTQWRYIDINWNRSQNSIPVNIRSNINLYVIFIESKCYICGKNLNSSYYSSCLGDYVRNEFNLKSVNMTCIGWGVSVEIITIAVHK